MSFVACLVTALVLARMALARRREWPARRLALVVALAVVAAGAAVLFLPDSFSIRKLLGLCVMPTGIVWVALAALAWGLAEARRWRFAAAAGGVWLLYTLAGNVWLGNGLARWLERDYAAIDPLAAGPFEAVLVLGGGVELREDGSGMISTAGERVVLAAALLRAGRTGRLVAPGPVVRLADGRTIDYPSVTTRIWAGMGVPEGAAERLVGPRTTGEEIAAFKAMVAARGWRRVGVLTSAWHMRRAMRLCRRLGLDASPVPADSMPARSHEMRWLVPQYQGFLAVQLACWELLGAALRQ